VSAIGRFTCGRYRDGRIVRELQEVGGQSHWVETAFDPEGNKLGRRTSLGHTEQVERDALGARVRTLLDGGIWLGHASDPLGRETSRLLPAGGRIETGFDPLGRVARRRAWHRTAAAGLPPGQPDWVGGGASPRGVTVDTAYRYSPDGELCEALDAARGRTAFKYDPVGQLLEMVPAQARAELFRFDPRGNLHEADPGAPQRVYGKGNRLLQKGATRYTWDDDGRLIEKRTPGKDGAADEVWRYAWNAAGLLAEVERPDGMRVRFAYDPFARRVEKELLRPAPGARLERISRTRFVWDGDVLAHELTERAEAAGDPVVEQRTYLYEDDSFEPVAHAEPGGRWVHYVNDQIGTPERLLEGNGEVACELRRSAWGQTEVQPGARATTPIRFQGQYEDAETGLAYNRWRYYDAEAGRFVSADPIGLLGGTHDYVYTPNAQSWIDPWGVDWNYRLQAGEHEDTTYYYGRASDSQSPADVMRRHRKSGRMRETDRLVQITPKGTPKAAVRGVEEEGIVRGGPDNTSTKTGTRGCTGQRGNVIHGIAPGRTDANAQDYRAKGAALLGGRNPRDLPAIGTYTPKKPAPLT